MEVARAPTAGAERSTPRPTGPVPRMSRAYTGKSAVAPPRSTAKRSRDMVLRSTATPDEADPGEDGGERDGLARARRPLDADGCRAHPGQDEQRARREIRRARPQHIKQTAQR